jgi:CRISPR-associated protein Csx14
MSQQRGSTIRVRVDPTNPGQFFACCGLLELADRLWGGAEGWFEDGGFRIEPDGDGFALLGTLVAEPPTEISSLGRIAVKPLLAPLHLTLQDSPAGLTLDAWVSIRAVKGSVAAIANPPWNFWSGQQTSFRIWVALSNALRDQLPLISQQGLENLFAWRIPLPGRFGFDPGAAWNAIDVGFSPNEQRMAVSSSPAVELLAAVGLQRFRPTISADRTRFVYGTWSQPLAPCAATVPASGIASCFQSTRFLGRVVSRGSYAALGFSTPLERNTP